MCDKAVTELEHITQIIPLIFKYHPCSTCFVRWLEEKMRQEGRKGKERKGKEREGKERKGKERKGKEREGKGRLRRRRRLRQGC